MFVYKLTTGHEGSKPMGTQIAAIGVRGLIASHQLAEQVSQREAQGSRRRGLARRLPAGLDAQHLQLDGVRARAHPRYRAHMGPRGHSARAHRHAPNYTLPSAIARPTISPDTNVRPRKPPALPASLRSAARALQILASLIGYSPDS